MKNKKSRLENMGVFSNQILSTSISIVNDLIERYPDDDDDESDKHI